MYLNCASFGVLYWFYCLLAFQKTNEASEELLVVGQTWKDINLPESSRTMFQCSGFKERKQGEDEEPTLFNRIDTAIRYKYR